MKHLHILGLSGTFMSALAIIAREAGYKVTGSDENCYPPVSDLLKARGIEWVEGYEDSSLALQADTVIIGNAIKRGMPVVEAVMAKHNDYISGPQWLAEQVLRKHKVIAVSGTHGKTTTTSMIAWILDYAGLKPGFLIGGVSEAFHTSARLGSGEWFVIEADEYDSAFFDKRPKFMHYRPKVAVLNNLEFDHADIYSDLEAIKSQFHYFLRTIPPHGTVVHAKHDASLNEVLSRGLFSKQQSFSLTQQDADWSATCEEQAGQVFSVYFNKEMVGRVRWSLMGGFNIENALAAIAASFQAGVSPEIACAALEKFVPVKRRLELKGEVSGIAVYDDFAHHPTAIAKTIAALKNARHEGRVLAVLEFASFTMKSGIHKDKMAQALVEADKVFILKPDNFQLNSRQLHSQCAILERTDDIINALKQEARTGDSVLVMSNRGFDNIHNRMLKALA